MSDKLEDTLAAIPSLVGGRIGTELQVQARAWAAAKGATGANATLELGGSLHSSSEKARRQAVRVYLLAYQALGLDDEIGALAKRREEILKLPMSTLQQRLRTDIEPYVMILVEEHKLRFGWSFRKPGTADLQNQLLRAWQRVPETLNASLAALGQVKSGGRGRGRGAAAPSSYTDFFGGTAMLDTVKTNVGLAATMAGRATLCLYYRGKNCHDSLHSDWPYSSFAPEKGIKPMEFMGAANRPKNREGPSALFQLKPHRNALQGEGDIHIMVGAQSENGTMMDMLHMIIHELTHFAAGTRDVKFLLTAQQALPDTHAMHVSPTKVLPMGADRLALVKKDGKLGYSQLPGREDRSPTALAERSEIRKVAVRTYGDTLCRAMAQTHPEKAATNADSYAYFCMQYARPG